MRSTPVLRIRLLGELDLRADGPFWLQAAYGVRLERLVALKDRYDPGNVFRLKANIAPSRRADR